MARLAGGASHLTPFKLKSSSVNTQIEVVPYPVGVGKLIPSVFGRDKMLDNCLPQVTVLAKFAFELLLRTHLVVYMYVYYISVTDAQKQYRSKTNNTLHRNNIAR